MFTTAEKMIFMNEVDPKILIRIVGEMNSVDLGLDGEQVEKN